MSEQQDDQEHGSEISEDLSSFLPGLQADVRSAICDQFNTDTVSTELREHLHSLSDAQRQDVLTAISEGIMAYASEQQRYCLMLFQYTKHLQHHEKALQKTDLPEGLQKAILSYSFNISYSIYEEMTKGDDISDLTCFANTMESMAQNGLNPLDDYVTLCSSIANIYKEHAIQELPEIDALPLDMRCAALCAIAVLAGSQASWNLYRKIQALDLNDVSKKELKKRVNNSLIHAGIYTLVGSKTVECFETVDRVEGSEIPRDYRLGFAHIFGLRDAEHHQSIFDAMGSQLYSMCKMVDARNVSETIDATQLPEYSVASVSREDDGTIHGWNCFETSAMMGSSHVEVFLGISGDITTIQSLWTEGSIETGQREIYADKKAAIPLSQLYHSDFAPEAIVDGVESFASMSQTLGVHMDSVLTKHELLPIFEKHQSGRGRIAPRMVSVDISQYDKGLQGTHCFVCSDSELEVLGLSKDPRVHPLPEGLKKDLIDIKFTLPGQIENRIPDTRDKEKGQPEDNLKIIVVSDDPKRFYKMRRPSSTGMPSPFPHSPAVA